MPFGPDISGLPSRVVNDNGCQRHDGPDAGEQMNADVSSVGRGLLSTILMFLFCVSCGSSSSPEGSIEINFDFDSGLDGWAAGFADYPVGQEDNFELFSSWERLPAPLDNINGFLISGINHSDDLFMFIKKTFSGFDPNTRYDVDFEITIATNVPSACAGVGGSPGESVFIKAGAISFEPVPENDGAGFFLMNIDKGNQSVGGSNAIVIGNFANTRTNCMGTSYEEKLLTSEGNSFTVFPSSEGVLWLLFATDSGFESTTSIFYLRGTVILTPF